MLPVVDKDKSGTCSKFVDNYTEDILFGSKKGEISIITYQDIVFIAIATSLSVLRKEHLGSEYLYIYVRRGV